MPAGFIKKALGRFWKDQWGTAALETMVMLPFLFMGLGFTFEYYDLFHYRSVREKATYTVADMLSRETAVVNDIYIDNAKTLFDTITSDGDDNQLRVSVVRYHKDDGANIDEFELRWSEVRGNGAMVPLTTNNVKNAHATLPQMIDGQEIVVVETQSVYNPTTTMGFAGVTPIETRMFMSLRFAAQLCFEGVCDPT